MATQPQSEEVITETAPDDGEFRIIEKELTLEEIEEHLREYEKEYGMSSEEFFALWIKGSAPYYISDSVGWGLLCKMRSWEKYKQEKKDS